MKRVNVGTVAVFDHVEASKAQALKVLEEAAEVFCAWQKLRNELCSPFCNLEACKKNVLDECADVITATCNLCAAFGVDDMQEIMKRCERRNRERGRL